MDLFQASSQRRRVHQPLAERMRPRDLEGYAGQKHLLGPGKLLARVAGGGHLPSLILWGPPGTGKTTLAGIIAKQVKARFESLSAVMAGVKEVRAVIATARERRDEYGDRTVLFIDEIHRYSKSQQDALLPHVESGVVTLIGATTENPSFEINAPLLSRCRVLRLEAIEDDELRVLAERALAELDRGLGELGVAFEIEALDTLVKHAHGDARRLLNTLEIAAHAVSADERSTIDSADVEEALQQKTFLYDKAGDEHYGVVSGLIKSLRGSDPDAALYWMNRMLEAGEDPLFILRRLVIFASEDVGNADPQALQVATGAVEAFRFVGLPEGALALTQCATYLACAPKSNAVLRSYAKARKAVREYGPQPVPKKLLNAATALGREMGHGKGYRYPHDFEGNYVPEDYLPEALSGSRFYEPAQSGHEKQIAERLDQWRSQRKANTGE